MSDMVTKMYVLNSLKDLQNGVIEWLIHENMEIAYNYNKNVWQIYEYGDLGELIYETDDINKCINKIFELI